jgi:hypothetical protein
VERTLTSSARSRIRLMTFPIRCERTRSLFKTSLYSSRMSSVISQTKWFFSPHLWSTSALGFDQERKVSGSPICRPPVRSCQRPRAACGS